MSVHTGLVPPTSLTFTNNFCPGSSAAPASPTPNPELLKLSPAGQVLLLVTDKPALEGYGFVELTTFPRKRMLWVLVEKISTRKDLVIVPGPEGDKATGGCCSLGANLIHHQDGFVETLGRKSQALPLREHELGLRED